MGDAGIKPATPRRSFACAGHFPIEYARLSVAERMVGIRKFGPQAAPSIVADALSALLAYAVQKRAPGLAIGAAIALGIVLSCSTAADAQSVMKPCGEQWKAARAAGTTNGETWPQFLAQCRAQPSGGAAAAAPTHAPAPVAPAPTSGQARSCAKPCDRCRRICE